MTTLSRSSLSVAVTDAALDHEHEQDQAYMATKRLVRVEPLGLSDHNELNLPSKRSPTRSALRSPTKKLVMGSPPRSPTSIGSGDKKQDIKLRTAVLQQVLELLDRDDSVVETTRNILCTLGNLQLDRQEVRQQALEVLQNLQGKYASQLETQPRNSGRAKQQQTGGLRHCKAFLLACANEIVELDEENPKFDYAETCSDAEFPNTKSTTKDGKTRQKTSSSATTTKTNSKSVTSSSPTKTKVGTSATKKRCEIRNAANSPTKVGTTSATPVTRTSASPPKCSPPTKEIFDYCSSVDTCSVRTAPSEQALADQGSSYLETVNRAEELDDCDDRQPFRSVQRYQALQSLTDLHARVCLQRTFSRWRLETWSSRHDHEQVTRRQPHNNSNRSQSQSRSSHSNNRKLAHDSTDLALKSRAFEALRVHSRNSSRNQLRKQLAFCQLRQNVLDVHTANDNVAEDALQDRVHHRSQTPMTRVQVHQRKPGAGTSSSSSSSLSSSLRVGN